MQTCKECQKPIPEERTNKAYGQTVVFCTKMCGILFHREVQRAKRFANRTPKKCLYCDEPTNLRKSWCNKECRRLYFASQDPDKIKPAVFADLNRGFAWDEPEIAGLTY